MTQLTETNNIIIKNYKVQGLDLIITKPNGEIDRITNGLADIILGEITLSTEKGVTISQDEVLSSITMNLGADAIYIKEQFTSEMVDVTEKEHNDEIEEKQLGEKLDELNKKNQELAKAIRELQSTNEEKEQQLNSSITKLNQAKSQINQQKKVDKIAEENNHAKVSSHGMTTPVPVISASTNSTSENPKAKPLTSAPKSQLFIQGKLSEDSDSGTAGDNTTNINMPMFTGMVSLDAKAHLVIAGSQYAITPNQEGNWSLTIPAALPDGIHEYQLIASRDADDSVTVHGQITVDSSIELPSISLDIHSDTGTVGDNITNQPHPTFTGKAEIGSTVTLQIGSQSLSTIASQQGLWRIALEDALPEGLSHYQVTATDIAGNHKTVDGTVTVKTTLPSAKAQLADRSGFLTNETTPTLTGQTDAKATVVVRVAGEQYSTTADDAGDWSLALTQPLADGHHLMNVTVTDMAGNSAVLAQSLLIDTVLPASEATLLASRDSGVIGDNITQHRQPTLTGQTKPQADITLEMAGATHNIRSNADGVWQFTVPQALQDGAYDYQVTVKDTAGNQSTTHGRVTIDSQVSHLSVDLDAASDTGEQGDSITNQLRPTFVGQAEAGSTLTLMVGAQSVSTTADRQGAWRVTVNDALPEGLSHYQVTATDIAGNHKTVDGTVTVKTTLPSAKAQLADRSGFLTNETTPTLTGQTDAKATVVVRVAGEQYSTTADDAGDWSLALTQPLADGHHLMNVTVTDMAGNSAVLAQSLLIDTVLPASEATLLASRDSGVIGDNITQHRQPTLTGQTKPQADITVEMAGATHNIRSNADGVWQFTVPQALQDGDYDYQVTVKDTAGNVSSKKCHFIVDSKVALTAGLDIASQSDTILDGVSTHLIRPQISGQADPDSKITAEFKGTTKTVYADKNGKWSLTFDINANIGKDNQYTVTAQDVAGNIETVSTHFNYYPSLTGSSDTPLPTLNVALDSLSDSGQVGDYITKNKAPKFVGTATKGTKISFVIDGKTYTTAADASSGQWEIVVEPLPEGNNNYQVTATNPISGKSVDVFGSVFIDAVGPSSTVELTPETDTGGKGNFITTHRQPVFTGQGEANCEVVLTLNNQSVSTKTDENGRWSLSLNKSLPGNFSGDFNVSIKDIADNVFERNGKLVIDNSIPKLSEIELVTPHRTSRNFKGLSINELMPSFKGKASANTEMSFSFNLNSKKYSFPIRDIDKEGNWSFSLPKGLLAKNKRYIIDDVAVKATSITGIEATQVFSKGIQVQDLVFNVTSEVAAESSMTGVNDPYLSASKAPKLQGSLTANYYYDEVVGYISIAGQEYRLMISGDGRREWSVQLPQDIQLIEGKNAYTLTFRDAYGSEFKHSSYVQVTDFNYWLDPDTDTGILGDNYTYHKHPVYKGTAEFGAKISARVNDEIHQIPVNEKGEWRFDVPTKGDGVYNIIFTQDNNGVIIGKQTLHIDSSSPIYHSYWLHLNDVHSEQSKVAKMNDPKIYFVYQSDVDRICVDVNGQEYKFGTPYRKFNGKSTELGGKIDLPNGEHLLKITAYNKAGNKLVHEQQVYVLGGDQGKNPPKIEFGINSFQKISAEQGQIAFNKNTIKLVGTTSAASTLEIKDLHGNVLGRTKANNEGEWAIALPAMTIPADIKQGESVILSISAKDLINRETQFNFNLVYDNTPPLITAELDHVICSGNQINTNQPKFTGKTDEYAEVILKINGQEYSTNADSKGDWSLTIPENHQLDEGKYDYHIAAKNLLGIMSEKNIEGAIIVKTEPTIIGGIDESSDSGIKGDNLTHVQTPKIIGITEPNAKVRIVFDDNVADTYETLSDPQGNWSIDVTSALNEGEHHYLIIVDDVIQQIHGEKKGSLVIDTIAPNSLIGGVTDDSSVAVKDNLLTQVTTPTFSGRSEPFARILLGISATTHSDLRSESIIADKNGNWKFTVPTANALQDGEYHYFILSEDEAGNCDINSVISGKIEIDTQAPDFISDIASTAVQDLQGAVVTSANTPIFKGTTEAGALVTLYIANQYYKTTANAQGEWYLEVTEPLPDGTHNYQLRAEDAVGNQSPEQVGQVMVDTQAPDLIGDIASTAVQDLQGAVVTSANTPIFKGTTEAGALVTLYIANQYYKTTANAQGEWHLEVTEPLPDGTHDYQLRAEDAVGNQSPEQVGQVTVDTQAPAFITTSLKALVRYDSPDSTLIFDGQAEPDSTINIYIDNKNYGTAKSDPQGNWQLKLEDYQGKGDFQYTVEIQDIVGNSHKMDGVMSIENPILPQNENMSISVAVQPIDMTAFSTVDDIHF
ncbi:Ig-like domain-containing protein [Providencia rettgeri]|uniref:Ig-like domain-containing protein n=1 Tax=Providencia rettgeri TaxID=587 RepID=UPI0034E060D2